MVKNVSISVIQKSAILSKHKLQYILRKRIIKLHLNLLIHNILKLNALVIFHHHNIFHIQHTESTITTWSLHIKHNLHMSSWKLLVFTIERFTVFRFPIMDLYLHQMMRLIFDILRNPLPELFLLNLLNIPSLPVFVNNQNARDLLQNREHREKDSW